MKSIAVGPVGGLFPWMAGLVVLLVAGTTLGAEPASSPPPAGAGALAKRPAPPNPKLVKLPFAFPRGMENTPVIFRQRPMLVQNERSIKPAEQEQAYLFVQDLVTGREVARLGTGFSFVSAFVHGDELNVFGTVNTNKEWTKDVYRFWSSDLKSWRQEPAIRREGDEHLFNTSVCRDGQGFLMAYESNKPVQWSFRFARSKDLARWELSPTRHPMLDPIPGEGINNTDADLFEHEGNTYVYYATGDQATWGTIRVAMYAGPMREFLEAYFPAGVPAIRFDATKGKYLYLSGGG